LKHFSGLKIVVPVGNTVCMSLHFRWLQDQ
jgi:hypothetical protein